MDKYGNHAEGWQISPTGKIGIMKDGQVLARLHEVVAEPGGVVDSHGDTFVKKQGWMSRVDAKGSEKIELSKGTIALFALAPALLMLVFTYGGSALGWARDDQSQKMEI